MKKSILFLTFFSCAMQLFAGLKISDATFLAFLKKNYPDCISLSDGTPTLDETCPSVLNAKTIDISGTNIKSLMGIEAFVNLQVLNCSNNQLLILPSLPANLQVLNCSNNQLEILPTLPANLTGLYCAQNHLATLPSLPTSLQYLSCSNNVLTQLPELSRFLQTLICDNNNLQTLPTLPETLSYLQINHNHINQLPAFPNSLTFIDCSKNLLSDLPKLPINLSQLNCSVNTLFSLPIVPKTLTHLNCSSNQLKTLPESSLVEANLVEFHCSDNQLSNLPDFTSAIIELSCDKNRLIRLPELAASLQILNCATNELTELPDLPSNLKKLLCNNNHITYLPSLPCNLEVLFCGHNPLLCLPALPVKLQHLNTQTTQISCIPNALPSIKLEPKLQICDGASACSIRSMNYSEAFSTETNIKLDSIDLQLPLFVNSQLIHYQTFGDMAVMSGDILLGKPERIQQLHSKRKGTWSNGLITYTISPKFSKNAVTTIEQTIRYLNSHATLHIFFKPWTERDSNEVEITPKENGYASYLGCLGGKQVLYLDSFPTFGMILHTFGHALGLYHENQRADADKFIKVEVQNVQPNSLYNFEKLPYVQTTSYDFNSVMHNRAYAFSATPTSQGQPQYLGINTLTVIKTGSRSELAGPSAKPTDLGQRNKFSNLDIADINELYKAGIEKEMNGINMMYRFVAPSKGTFEWMVVDPINFVPTEFKGTSKVNEPFALPEKARGCLVIMYNDNYFYKMIQ
jgi:Leucine-rich repeat (LRR) protein